METTTNATHTPGPWTVPHSDSPYWHQARKGEQPIPVSSEVGVIADVRWQRRDHEANARLIAAAPDLLAALKEMYALYADHAQYDDSEEQHEVKAIGQAREAIAKATE
jgi:hypothetical protein